MKIKETRRPIFAERLVQACVAKWGREYGAASRLSEEMGVTVATAARWLRGEVTPEVERWGRLAVLLGVTVQWLTGETHEQPEALRGHVGERPMEIATRTVAITLPIVNRVMPGLPPDELEALATDVFRQLEVGEDEAAIEGRLYDILYKKVEKTSS